MRGSTEEENLYEINTTPCYTRHKYENLHNSCLITPTHNIFVEFKKTFFLAIKEIFNLVIKIFFFSSLKKHF